MATKNTTQQGVFPQSIGIKDLISIISTAVVVALAWGVFSTRITVLEKEIVSLREANQARDAAVERLQQQLVRQVAHQQDDEVLIDQLYTMLRKPVPTRRAPN